jgi:hypothetical protein
MSTLPRIRSKWDSSLELTFPYDPALVDALKANIPGRARSYDPATKVWTVTAAWAAIATRLMVETFGDVEIVDDRQEPYRRPDPIRTSDHRFAALHLMPSAPPELIEAAYRCLSKLHHPDRVSHGERDQAHRQMVAINTAYSELRDRASA